HPEDARLVRRLAKGEDRAVDLCAAVVGRNGAAGRAELLGVVTREIRADGLPARSFVGRAMAVVGADVEHDRVVRRELAQKSPLNAILEIDRARALAEVLGPDGHVALLPRLGVPGDQPAMTRAGADGAADDGMRWFAADSHVAALAATRLDVVVPAD